MASFAASAVVGYAALAAYLGVRLGLFGTVKIDIYADSEYERVTNCAFFHEAYWIAADTRMPVRHTSLWPIEFVMREERLAKY